MKKIHKQLAKEKARNEAKKKDIDEKKIKKEERKGKNSTLNRPQLFQPREKG